MNRRRKPIATAIIIAAFAALTPAAEAWAADSDEVKALQQEVRQMRAQVQALVAAITETTELEKQRSANFSRALQQPAATSEPAARAPAAAPAAGGEAGGGAGETKPAAAPAPARDDRGRGAAHRRHHRSSGRSRSKDR